MTIIKKFYFRYEDKIKFIDEINISVYKTSLQLQNDNFLKSIFTPIIVFNHFYIFCIFNALIKKYIFLRFYTFFTFRV